MLTIFVTTILVLVLSLFVLMAIVLFMLESNLGDGLPDNVVHLASRRHVHHDERDAA